MPTSRQEIFTTTRDNQTAVKIRVLQGESERADDNELLGEFVLTGIPPGPKGEPEIEVTFDIDANGIVSVSARDLATGRAQSIQVNPRGTLVARGDRAAGAAVRAGRRGRGQGLDVWTTRDTMK